MINDGIYEQIVNEKLQKELDQLDLVLCQDLVQIKMRGSAS